MHVSLFLRNYLTRIPLAVGQIITHIPFEWRPGVGRVYRKRRQELDEYQQLDNEQKKSWILQRVQNIVEYAVCHVPFYKNYYADQNFYIEQLLKFDSIKRIPIINKRILQNYDLDSRSNLIGGRQLVNTGGSSGHTLAFFIHAGQMGNEWAHMHRIWEKLGYAPHQLKISFGGRGDISQGFLQYDAVRHSYMIDIYADWSVLLAQVKKLVERHKVFYLHGYPSALYEFALACKQNDKELLGILQSQLRGAFLGSEFPMPGYRQTIEETFQIPSVSWYGHTERCILAYEKDQPYLYVPFQTYGYAEALLIGGQEAHLIGTSYYNYASPLIHYDTEDQVTAMNEEAGILTAFRVDNGRSGQFVVDKHGKNIPLTGLIFGRHHSLFNTCSHIQVFQPKPGKATILFVPVAPSLHIDPESSFDCSNVAIDFNFCQVWEPIRTSSGKINLLVTERDLQRQNVMLAN